MIPWQALQKLEHYVKERATGGKLTEYGSRVKVENNLAEV